MCLVHIANVYGNNYGVGKDTNDSMLSSQLIQFLLGLNGKFYKI